MRLHKSSRSLVVSPFLIMVLLYFVSNLYSALGAIEDGGMMLEGVYFSLTPDSIIIAFCSQIAVIIFLVVMYYIFYPGNRERSLQFGSAVGIWLAVLQILYICFNAYYGVNVAGSEKKEPANSMLSYFFVFIPPDILFCIISVCIRSKKLMAANILIYLVSSIMRGWMGGLLIVVTIVACRFHPMRVKLRHALGMIILFGVTVLALPYLVEAKWAVRTNGSISSVVDRVSDIGYFESLSASVKYVGNRLQHVGHVALLVENSNSISSDYDLNKFQPYWMDGLPQYALLKILNSENVRLNTYMVSKFFGLANPTWNTNPGMAGWFFVLGGGTIFYILYVFLLLGFSFYFIARYAGGKLFLMLACFSIYYLFHGWIASYFNLALYSVLVCFMGRSRFKLPAIKAD